MTKICRTTNCTVIQLSLVALLSSAVTYADALGPAYVPKVYLPFWNSDQTQALNNCYNYATNRASGDFAQPGQAAGVSFASLRCVDVLAAAGKDLGVTATGFFPFGGKNDDTLIALVVAPDSDFHWYRRGDDGLWSHKPGGDEATTLDNSGHDITSPETADRAEYIDFCGYFRVRDYSQNTHEQNNGYVQIGSMSGLPSLPPVVTPHLAAARRSTVEAMMYSGRPNPAVPLVNVLSRLKVPAVQAVASALRRQDFAMFSQTENARTNGQLGYRGLQVIDHEGLLFPKGTLVRILDDQLSVKLGIDSWRKVHISRLGTLEKAILADILR